LAISHQPCPCVVKLSVPRSAAGSLTPANLYRYVERPERGVKVHINDKVLFKEHKDGYIVLHREWKKGDHLQIEFPMEVRKVIANDKAKADNEKVSLEIGPLVYVVEEADNNNVEDVRLKSEDRKSVV